MDLPPLRILSIALFNSGSASFAESFFFALASLALSFFDFESPSVSTALSATGMESHLLLIPLPRHRSRVDRETASTGSCRRL